MKFLVPFVLCAMASAQTVSMDVHFTLLRMADSYDAQPTGVAGATVRLVLGAGPDWQNPTAGHKFVTNDKGEARFTMNALLDTRWRTRNVGFTPFSWPVRADHMQIATELEQRIPLEKEGEFKSFRWLLTMDLDCFREGACSTVGLMGIYTPDEEGRFTKALPRQGGGDVWKISELNGMLLRGMGYEVADFSMEADPADPKRRTLKLAFKQFPRIVQH